MTPAVNERSEAIASARRHLDELYTVAEKIHDRQFYALVQAARTQGLALLLGSADRSFA